jgi:LPPG:FO 2-phospho-L-lactate transferase
MLPFPFLPQATVPMSQELQDLKVTALAGGVGAARFLRGLVRVINPANLCVIVNTGDDDEFFGLSVSPDLDTITYTLADVVDHSKGWGLPDESFRCLESLKRYYPDTWFGLGDTDLATHLFRTEQLRQGKTLTEVTTAIAQAWGVKAAVLPMSNDPVRTVVHTEAGALPFQDYFVKGRGEGNVEKVELRGIESATAAPGVCEAIRSAQLVILPPSNPIVSIGPIIGLPGVREALRETSAPIVGISPLVAGKPIKGPADRMLSGLGIEASAAGVAGMYKDFLDSFVIDTQDASQQARLEEQGLTIQATDTIMTDMDKSVALAQTVIEQSYTKRSKT